MSKLIADVYNDRVFYPGFSNEYLFIEDASVIHSEIYVLLRSQPAIIIDVLISTIFEQPEMYELAEISSKDDILIINENIDGLYDKVDKIFSGVWCKFADKNKHWFHYITLSERDFSSHPDVIDALCSFMNVYQLIDSDGFYLIVDNAGVNSDEDLAKITLSFFTDICKKVNNSVLEDIQHENWRFTLNGEEVYLLVFSNHYSSNHSRYLPLNNCISFLIQPDNVFDKFSHDTEKIIKGNVRSKIRENYLNKGVTYNYILSESRDHKSKFVKSTRIESIINWWEV